MPSSSDAVTQWLRAGRPDQPEALDQLMPLVYEELRRLARRYLRRLPPGQTLQATALVHEAYLRLVGPSEPSWQNRAHFLAIAARQMRSILVDYARRRWAAKRGGAERPLTLEDAAAVTGEKIVDLLAIDEALSRLADLDPVKGRVVELHFFGGLTLEETAEVLGVTARTVSREWRRARAWLHRQLTMNAER